MAGDTRPLVVHIIQQLSMGGLENGLINLINTMPASRYRHAVVCLAGYSEFRNRIRRDDVEVHALHKRMGKDFGVYVRLWRLLRRLRPAIVHTRNLSALDAQVAAALAGVPHRVHGEHGWDVYDLHGTNRKYRMLRRALRPLVHRYTAVSRHIASWLRDSIGVPERKLVQIYNGVDDARFHPPPEGRRAPLPAEGFAPPGAVVFGTVSRMQRVKDTLNLVRAFILLAGKVPEAGKRLRLALIGDGELREQAIEELERAGLRELAWIPGARDDVAELLRALDVFVLPSLNEGISNTILEAMASGLPVVATAVGGNPELVVDGATGFLVPPSDSAALASALEKYVEDPSLAAAHGRAARQRVLESFSLGVMVGKYMEVYDGLLKRAPVAEAIVRR
jgi:sugar transferase (PEP-CTERM/EpsH1 system associated)